MDINEMKNIWKDSFGKDNLSDEQIMKVIHIRKSANIALFRILKNYKYGLITGTFFYIVIIVFLLLLVRPGALWFLIPIVTALTGTSYAFVLKSFITVRKACNSGDNVKTTLEKSIGIIDKYVSFSSGTVYKYLLIPFSLVLGIILGLFIAAGEQGISETIRGLESSSLIKIILVIVLGSLIVIPVSQNLVRKFYSQHLNDLKKCLDELENL